MSERIRAFTRFYTSAIDIMEFNTMHPDCSAIAGRIMYEISAHKHITANELIDIVHIDRGYLSRILANLERKQFLVREISELDRRRKELALTDSGMVCLKEIIDIANQKTNIQFMGLDKEDLETMTAAMELIRDIYARKHLVYSDHKCKKVTNSSNTSI